MSKNYSGSDLPSESKTQLKKWINQIKKILTEKNCTNLDFHYGFHYFSGFFTAPSGQIYYISSFDIRGGGEKMYYRTAKSYKDFTGGANRSLESIEKLKTVNFI